MDQQPKEVFIIRREDAKAQGLDYYFTGRQCKARHVSVRKVSNGACVACAKAYAAAYYQKRKRANPDGVRAAVNEAVKRHYQANREAILEKKRRYYLENAEAIKARTRDYRAGKQQTTQEGANP